MIFVDTSAWLAIADIRDGNHRAALAFHEKLVRGMSGRLMTTDYVMDETLTLMRKGSGADTAKEFVNRVQRSTSIQQIWITPGHYGVALELFLGQRKKSWSFTDCTSFTIMREFGIRHAFTFDAGFRQAGFDPQPV